ncbi:MAG: NAD(P)/FAD-dependent oxidoreductase [Prevotellaceae bacterium]|nr:NAD(P)/FAD-dependent oxidoreductase [Prevotellaceae bacterium]
MENSKYDTIIAGSGLGGLVCGYILAKNGYRVAIFEKNAQVGGCLQTFTRRGVKFDTGMHYIGSMKEGQILHQFFKYLDLLKDVRLSPLDTAGFEVISLAGQTFKYAQGVENFIDVLAREFPENREDIKRYAEKIKAIADSSPLYNLHKLNSTIFIDTEMVTMSASELIDSVTDNPKLRQALAGNLPLYAGVKDKTPVYIQALLNNFYIQSAYRIVGGSDCIANSLAKSIENFGGKIYKNAEIEELICDSEKMTKIRLASGQEYEAQSFISNIHPQVTLDKIHSPLIRKVYRDRIKSIENGISNFTVFLIFKKNMVKYLNYNYYYYEKPDAWSIENYAPQEFPQNYLYMHQANAENQEFAESAQVIAYMRYDEVKRWENTTIGQRGADYEAFKKEKAEKTVEKLNQQFPHIKDCISAYYTSSPLTYRDYTATVNGAMYGIIRDKNNPMETRISQRTKISNFFFTGQNINTHGILGVTIGAITTAAEILGKKRIVEDICKNS